LGCSALLPILLLTMVVVVLALVVVPADGGLGHGRMQSRRERDESRDVEKVGQNAVQNKHYKVGKTHFMRQLIWSTFGPK
jgi:hypothetical protein